jgi:hypothetical protein
MPLAQQFAKNLCTAIIYANASVAKEEEREKLLSTARDYFTHFDAA